ncbi:hypothetical protein VP01_4620g3 [Puccinia sorghi]|uniref:Uncharacterized protein n=1 Tax=Puccinia sorghi TaxID=27349 RepID=A0A0L6UNF6_9BASI|nr:hypothetical protein VP01_4620g3 [Puccinia sorghi]
MSRKKSTKISRVSQRIHEGELGDSDIHHRMSMPLRGHLMAEVFNRPFFYYGKSWSQTFFLLKTVPNNSQTIFMSMTERRHFVVLKMKDENLFPVAQLERNWEQIATPEVIQGKNRYLRCFEFTQRLKLETGFDKYTF